MWDIEWRVPCMKATVGASRKESEPEAGSGAPKGEGFWKGVLSIYVQQKARFQL